MLFYSERSDSIKVLGIFLCYKIKKRYCQSEWIIVIVVEVADRQFQWLLLSKLILIKFNDSVLSASLHQFKVLGHNKWRCKCNNDHSEESPNQRLMCLWLFRGPKTNSLREDVDWCHRRVQLIHQIFLFYKI